LKQQDKQRGQADSKTTILERLSLSCNRYSECALLVIGLAMIIIIIVQVFCRYILNHSLFWSEELARMLLVWMTFLGASVAYHRTIHPGINFLYRRLSPRFKQYANRITHLFSFIFFSIMVWHGCQFAYFVRLQTTPALALPKWIIYSIIPISGMILALHAAASFIGDRNRSMDEL